MQTEYRSILSLLSILAVGFLFFRLYRDYAVAKFRQDLFMLRDEIFDYAASGHIKFDDPVYELLRTTINGFIRYGHRLSFTELIVFSVLKQRNPEYDNTYSRRWNEASKGLDKSTVVQLLDYRSRMHLLVVEHIIMGSPGLVLTLIVPAIFLAMYYGAKTYCKVLYNYAQPWLKSPLNDIDAVAAAYGQ